MAYQVDVEHRAARSLVRIARGSPHAARRLRDAMRALGDNPRPPGCVKLTANDGYRIRVGDYRVVYVVEDAIKIVTVTPIGHRREGYER